MAIDEFMRDKFPNWITDIYNNYNPPKVESPLSQFRDSEGNYKPFYKMNWSKFNRDIKVYFQDK